MAGPADLDPQSTLVGVVVTTLLALIATVVRRLLSTVRPMEEYQKQLREELQKDMETALNPIREDIREIKDARLGERLATVEAEVRHFGGKR